MALKQGLSVPNAPGTIDADYRGEVKVLLVNLGTEAFTITRGMRIAQMVIAKVEKAAWREVKSRRRILSSTERRCGRIWKVPDTEKEMAKSNFTLA